MQFQANRQAAVILAALSLASGNAQARPRLEPAAMAQTPAYLIEFAARPTQAFGHSYVRLVSVGRDGREHVDETAGFYPASAKQVFDTRGIVTATKADLTSRPSVSYRVAVSAKTYAAASSYVRRLSQTWKRYDLTGQNCNHMIGDVARTVGLTSPGDYDDLPENYVRSLRAQNGGRERASWRGSRKLG
jgi:hypothetical protein